MYCCVGGQRQGIHARDLNGHARDLNGRGDGPLLARRGGGGVGGVGGRVVDGRGRRLGHGGGGRRVAHVLRKGVLGVVSFPNLAEVRQHLVERVLAWEEKSGEASV